MKFKFLFPFVLILFMSACGVDHPGSEVDHPNRVTNSQFSCSNKVPPDPLPIGLVVNRIIVIVLENENASEALKQPYLSQLKLQGAYLNNYHAITYPSEPNYMTMIGGSTFGITDDEIHDVDALNITDLLEAKGKSWQVFAENFPGACFKGSLAPYNRNHNPFMNFVNITENANRCSLVTNANNFFTLWDQDLLPAFSFYIPNDLNNGHDNGVAFASNWLEQTFGPYFSNPEALRDTLVFIIFDEDDRNAGSQNLVYALMLGSTIKPGSIVDTCYSHYSLLRTIEDIWQLGTLGKEDEKDVPIGGVWEESND